MIHRIRTAYEVMRVTHKYFRASQVPDGGFYYLNGTPKRLYGQYALTMAIGISLHDCYGLKRFKYLENIVDIGANIGVFTLYASLLFPKAKIAAYEPFLPTFENLKKNLEVQGNVAIYPYAVGDSNREVELNYQGDASACYVSDSSSINSIEHQKTCMKSFDEIANQFNSPIGLLKLDCEGSEYEIMRCASFETVRYVVGELHTCPQGTPELGLEILKERGFIIDKWLPYPDGKAGDVWARNARNTGCEEDWLA
ncbi:FkbM family methyltransferase [Desertifilum sp. FACHB-1129]|nr:MULTISPECIES: FkbM family methyltransferase [Desertifilum]MBD2310989.1 FkbM family methyltransferase [Desertifilum sp. FACHB-1129]MBD2321394.1 FkbM family methyltransferase [Desertifilum sp. FACHB-866]MBD2331299.1 FkbM family methyltransferase [Desertifilum sp. FACHB-868]MDA0208787.1 FkbM family methyltransferase [Cyanobacteria bacterium FC1]